jgi:hypothetical protein
MARGTCLTREPVRNAVRWLVDLGALRLIRRSKKGHLVEARVPGEIRAARFDAATVSERVRLPDAVELEEIDFMQTKILRGLSTRGSAGDAFTVCGGSRPRQGAWTTWCRARSRDPIPTATWCPPAWNAIRTKGRSRRRIFSAGCTANAV